MERVNLSFKASRFQLMMLLFLFLLGVIIEHPLAYFFGLIIAVVNVIIYWLYYYFYGIRESKYKGQALVAVISSMIVRFLVVTALIFYALRIERLSSKWLLIGFSLGLLLYWYNHMFMVSKKYGK